MARNSGKPRLLSRSARGLYWIGRYLERAEYLCRLLRFHVEALVDRPIREIYFGWSRIYMSLNRRPPGGSITMAGNDDFTLADSTRTRSRRVEGDRPLEGFIRAM